MIALNGQQLTFMSYPNGETRVDGEQILKLAESENRISLKYETDGDLLKLLFVKSFLDDHRCKASLLISYMPYSRMDRVEGSSVFTLKYTAHMINAMNFERVTIIEPHSDVSTALIHRSEAIYPTGDLLQHVIEETGFHTEKDYLFFPDAGAQKRYSKLGGYRELVGFKKRNFETGRIEQLDVVGTVGETGFKAIIIDDLCSYGGTFLLSAERLRELGASEVYLLVSHCEDSIYEGKLLTSGLIDRVYTTDTILSQASTDLMKMFPIGGMYK
ncbi:ribose-phosphate pyrophosphokinase [Paenibacillus pinisoli]|uniref:Ribose-phosphate pyrophosphokinase n=1 Tax=Paenibacillus pinisoli TaxID=1276110 RepID=A0A3A6PE68_9BACL|nr:ribose-phosphate pyrophosphokinase [Paenibacillus pinisoli]RJX38945.1 ribose-phosphate pyrophosphokinase [Paenibacillus pinisoli]